MVFSSNYNYNVATVHFHSFAWKNNSKYPMKIWFLNPEAKYIHLDQLCCVLVFLIC